MTFNPTKTVSLLILPVLMAASTAIAQAPAQAPTDSSEPTLVQSYEPQLIDLRVIDQRVEDFGGISKSLRHFDTGLHQPNDFAKVYQTPGGNTFMRVQGALFAVYPQSVYSGAAGTGSESVPPGTVFYIGSPPSDNDLPDGTNLSPMMINNPLRWNTRISILPIANNNSATSVNESANENTSDNTNSDHSPRQYDKASTSLPQLQPIPETRQPNSDIDDDRSPAIRADRQYRKHRLRELLQRAAQAKQRS